MLIGMVRIPLSPEQVAAGQRLGVLMRTARAGRDPELIARNAGISHPAFNSPAHKSTALSLQTAR